LARRPFGEQVERLSVFRTRSSVCEGAVREEVFEELPLLRLILHNIECGKALQELE